MVISVRLPKLACFYPDGGNAITVCMGHDGGLDKLGI